MEIFSNAKPPHEVADLVHDALVDKRFWIYTDEVFTPEIHARLDAIRVACQTFINGPFLKTFDEVLTAEMRSARIAPTRYRAEPDSGDADQQTVLFGSCNWSRSGFTRNHELDLLVRDATLARVFLSRLEQDWATSPP